VKIPKSLMEAINETCDAIEQAACGQFAPKKILLVADWEDSTVGNYTVTLTSDGGGYSADWDIDVTEKVPDDLEATGPKEPLILANPPRKVATKKAAPTAPKKAVRPWGKS
jgi:hypothetical protein